MCEFKFDVDAFVPALVCAAPKRLLCSLHKAHAAEPPHSAAGVKTRLYTYAHHSRAPCPCAGNFLYNSTCKKKAAETRVQTIVLRMYRTRQSALILLCFVCFESCTDAAVREMERNAESEVYLGLKISDHMERVREELSM